MSTTTQKIFSSMIIAVSVFVSCIFSAAGLVIVGSGAYIPGWMPTSMKFSKINNARMVGTPSMIKYNRLSETKCLERCSANVGCLSAVHIPNKKTCVLYATNAQADPDGFADEWDGGNYFEKKYFWSRFTPQQTGSMEDVGGIDIVHEDIENVQECAFECLKQSSKPECKGFNYVPSRQRCQLLATTLEGNESLIDETDEGSYYGLLKYDLDRTNEFNEVETFKNPKNPKNPKSNRRLMCVAIGIVICVVIGTKWG